MRDRETILKWLRYCALESPEHGCVESCPYLQLQDESENAFCGDILMADALALLTPRVLTVDEVREADFAYVQYDSGKTYPCMVTRAEEVVSHPHTSLSVECADADNWDGYGRSWRCWSEKPTEKQMKEVPWDEG